MVVVKSDTLRLLEELRNGTPYMSRKLKSNVNKLLGNRNNYKYGQKYVNRNKATVNRATNRVLKNSSRVSKQNGSTNLHNYAYMLSLAASNLKNLKSLRSVVKKRQNVIRLKGNLQAYMYRPPNTPGGKGGKMYELSKKSFYVR